MPSPRARATACSRISSPPSTQPPLISTFPATTVESTIDPEAA